MSAPILSPSFRWIPAASHSDVSAFAARQRERMERMQKASKPDPSNVKTLTRKGSKA